MAFQLKGFRLSPVDIKLFFRLDYLMAFQSKGFRLSPMDIKLFFWHD
jgi:hypothetical protein